LAVPVRADLIAFVDDLGLRLRNGTRRLLETLRDRWRAHASGLPRPADVLGPARQRSDLAAMQLASSLGALIQAKRTISLGIAPRLSGHVLAGRAREQRRRLIQAHVRLVPGLSRRIEGAAMRLGGVAKLLNSLSFQGVLERGFALLRDAAGAVLRDPAAVAAGDRLDIQLAGGSLAARVEPTPAGGGVRIDKPQAAAKPKAPRGGQQSLF
jgi:exodeoxyribonuclease VII large subunit